MTPRKHSALARALIKASGGLDEAARECRLAKSALGNAQNPNFEYYLPADVIVELEEYCGRSIYSQAMLDASPQIEGDTDIIGDALAMVSAVAKLVNHAHHAQQDGNLSGLEIDKIRSHLQTIDTLKGQLEADLSAAETDT